MTTYDKTSFVTAILLFDIEAALVECSFTLIIVTIVTVIICVFFVRIFGDGFTPMASFVVSCAFCPLV